MSNGIYNTVIGQRGEHEFLASDGSRALIVLTVTTEFHEHTPHGVCSTRTHEDTSIDPALAEVWLAVGRYFGHVAYAQESLQGEALVAWLDKHHDDLVSLAWDVASGDAERHDEEMAERR